VFKLLSERHACLENILTHRVPCIDSDNRSDSESDGEDIILTHCKEFLLESKAKPNSLPIASWKQSKKDFAANFNKNGKQVVKNHKTETEEIIASVHHCRKAADQHQLYAWLLKQKGGHNNLDCIQRKCIAKITAFLLDTKESAESNIYQYSISIKQ